MLRGTTLFQSEKHRTLVYPLTQAHGSGWSTYSRVDPNSSKASSAAFVPARSYRRLSGTKDEAYYSSSPLFKT